MRKGFTLVELSIVLVIIGLLIGGVLIGQSMISTANLNKFIIRIQQFDIATANFQQKFNSLPGDSAAFGGNGNGVIEDNSGSPVTQEFSGERANFWVDLQQSGFFDDGRNYTATITGSFNSDPANPNAPVMPMGTETSAVECQMGVGSTTNAYCIESFNSLTPTSYTFPSPGAGLSTKEMAELSSKLNWANGLNVGTRPLPPCLSPAGFPSSSFTCPISIVIMSQTNLSF